MLDIEFGYTATESARLYIQDLSDSVFSRIEFSWDEINRSLRGNPAVEDPRPGFNICAQVIIYTRKHGDALEILRAILPEIEDDPIEFDVLLIKGCYDPKLYLHPSTEFIFNKTPSHK